MATLILTTVGGVIGGRIGSAVGALVGQVVDQAIFAPAPRQGPRLSDLSVQSSSYGAAIPKIFGRTRVAGSVIWSTDLIETRSTQGGGKGRADTETYSYSASFAVLLSGRRIVRVERIWADGKLLRGAAGDLKVELAALRIHYGDPDQAADPLIASAEGADAPAWRGQAYVVFEGLQLAEYGNRIPSLSFEVVADDAPVGVGAIIGELAGAGADAGPAITGFTASGSSVRAVAESIAAAFPVIVRAGDAPPLRFDTVAVPAPETSDLGAFAGEARVRPLDVTIDPLETTPVALSIAYLDPERDYQAGAQRVRREGGGLLEGRIDLPAVLDAGNAYGAVNAAMSRLGVERTRAKVSLPWRAITFRPGDRIEIGGASWRVAAVQLEQMVVKLDLVRTGDLAVGAVTATPGRGIGEVDVPSGPTTLAVIDLPPLTDQAETRSAVTVFANGSSSGWRRAALLVSADGGATYAGAGSTALPATIGETATALPAASAALIDKVNAVDVILLNDAMTLSDADIPSLLAGANLAMVGDELIQFGRAALLVPGHWRLSDLWRGRRGTEDAIVAHPAGSRFVLVEAGTGVVLLPHLAVPGITVMASGIGDTSPYPTAVCTTAGRCIMPLSPVALSAHPLPGGDIELRWIRRSREGWAWRDGVDVPLAEEREAYRVAWADDVHETAEPRFLYTAAMRAVDLAAGRTSIAFEIRQAGASALSSPAVITIDIV